MRALARPLDALAFDMPGHGRSPPLPAPPDDLHAAVAALVPSLQTQLAPDGRPALLIGHSFGGAAVLRHALDHPASVAGLVLIEPVFFAAARHSPEYDSWLAQDAPIHDAVARGDLAGAARLFLHQNGDGTPWEALPPPMRAAVTAQMAMLPASGPGLVQDSGGLLTPGRLEGFAPPVLLLAGGDSAPIFRAVTRALARRLPRARHRVLPGAGHMLPITHARQVAELIDTWRQDCGL